MARYPIRKRNTHHNILCNGEFKALCYSPTTPTAYRVGFTPSSTRIFEQWQEGTIRV